MRHFECFNIYTEQVALALGWVINTFALNVRLFVLRYNISRYLFVVLFVSQNFKWKALKCENDPVTSPCTCTHVCLYFKSKIFQVKLFRQILTLVIVCLFECINFVVTLNFYPKAISFHTSVHLAVVLYAFVLFVPSLSMCTSVSRSVSSFLIIWFPPLKLSKTLMPFRKTIFA